MHVQCLFLKRIKGIEKSCLMATIPTLNDKGVCMLDVGANAENTVESTRSVCNYGKCLC